MAAPASAREVVLLRPRRAQWTTALLPYAVLSARVPQLADLPLPRVVRVPSPAVAPALRQGAPMRNRPAVQFVCMRPPEQRRE